MNLPDAPHFKVWPKLDLNSSCIVAVDQAGRISLFGAIVPPHHSDGVVVTAAELEQCLHAWLVGQARPLLFFADANLSIGEVWRVLRVLRDVGAAFPKLGAREQRRDGATSIRFGRILLPVQLRERFPKVLPRGTLYLQPMPRDYPVFITRVTPAGPVLKDAVLSIEDFDRHLTEHAEALREVSSLYVVPDAEAKYSDLICVTDILEKHGLLRNCALMEELDVTPLEPPYEDEIGGLVIESGEDTNSHALIIAMACAAGIVLLVGGLLLHRRRRRLARVAE